MSPLWTLARIKMKPAGAIITAFTAIAVSAAPEFASACASSHEITVSRAHWAKLRSPPAEASGIEATCRLYASSFYELVTLRQAARTCVGDADREQSLALLDAEIDAFNNLLAAKCAS